MTTRPAVPSGRAPIGIDARSTFALDVQYYLSQDPRQLPSRYLYDTLGSCLFEAICGLPWYPIARAETKLLASHRRDILTHMAPLGRIVELGCGSGEKLARLVGEPEARANPLELHLIDVSPSALTASSMRVAAASERVRVTMHQASYETGLGEVGALPRHGRTLVLFLGSNLGNFDPPGAHELLGEVRRALSRGDCLLLGVDLVKPERVLLEAYDDPLGVTAAFNRNLLVRINRELGGDFDLGGFQHLARWNGAESRIEMHLVSLRRQKVRVPAAGLEIEFGEGEAIWTESSYKYEPGAVLALAERAGFTPAAQWIDQPDRFALTLLAAT